MESTSHGDQAGPYLRNPKLQAPLCPGRGRGRHWPTECPPARCGVGEIPLPWAFVTTRTGTGTGALEKGLEFSSEHLGEGTGSPWGWRFNEGERRKSCP